MRVTRVVELLAHDSPPISPKSAENVSQALCSGNPRWEWLSEQRVRAESTCLLNVSAVSNARWREEVKLCAESGARAASF